MGVGRIGRIIELVGSLYPAAARWWFVRHQEVCPSPPLPPPPSPLLTPAGGWLQSLLNSTIRLFREPLRRCRRLRRPGRERRLGGGIRGEGGGEGGLEGDEGLDVRGGRREGGVRGDGERG